MQRKDSALHGVNEFAGMQGLERFIYAPFGKPIHYNQYMLKLLLLTLIFW